MREALMEGTGTGLLAFLDWCAEKGLLNARTAGAHKSAVTQILSIEGENLDEVDVMALDVEDVLTRFARRKGSKYSPGSLATYEGRFRRAVEMYGDYLRNPSGFRPGIRNRDRVRPRSQGTDAAPTSMIADPPTVPATTTPTSRDELITYPFPLRSGSTAYFQLPRELSSADVARMTKFLESVALDLESGHGAGDGP